MHNTCHKRDMHQACKDEEKETCTTRAGKGDMHNACKEEKKRPVKGAAVGGLLAQQQAHRRSHTDAVVGLEVRVGRSANGAGEG